MFLSIGQYFFSIVQHCFSMQLLQQIQENLIQNKALHGLAVEMEIKRKFKSFPNIYKCINLTWKTWKEWLVYFQKSVFTISYSMTDLMNKLINNISPILKGIYNSTNMIFNTIIYIIIFNVFCRIGILDSQLYFFRFWHQRNIFWQFWSEQYVEKSYDFQ